MKVLISAIWKPFFWSRWEQGTVEFLNGKSGHGRRCCMKKSDVFQWQNATAIQPLSLSLSLFLFSISKSRTEAAAASFTSVT
jgi:hypothetical protein